MASSNFYLCFVLLYFAWFMVCFASIYLGYNTFFLAIINLLVVISTFPFARFVFKRRLAATFMKLNIRPSHCGHCEYDLRATEGDTCPECGTKLVPREFSETPNDDD